MQPSIALALIFLASAGDCSRPADRTTAPNASTSSQMATAPVHLFTQQHSGYRAATETAIRDEAAWRTAWRTLHGGEAADPPPAVDFSREMVVLVSLGEINTGGYSVGIDGVAAEGNGAVVHYTVTTPGPGCMTTQALTAPVDVVRVPRAAGTVRFDKKTVREEC